MMIKMQVSVEVVMIEIMSVIFVVLFDLLFVVFVFVQVQGLVVEEICKCMDEIDICDIGLIVYFGVWVQNELQEISQVMLVDVKNKDVGLVGELLCNIVIIICGFLVGELDVCCECSFWECLIGCVVFFVKFVVNYEKVQVQIDNIIVEFDGYQYWLFKDIKLLDLFYDCMLDFYDELVLYIVVGEEKIVQIDCEDVFVKEVEMNVVLDDYKVMKVQELCDLCVLCDDLECCVYDLKLMCQVIM